jgi:outer membrane biosynthesis protein TonB
VPDTPESASPPTDERTPQSTATTIPTGHDDEPTTDVCARINRDGELPRGPNPTITSPMQLWHPPMGSDGSRNNSRAADVWRRALDTPTPPWSALERTTWARRDKRPGCTRVRFCVADDGRVDGVETILPFRGDPRVDEIVVNTVSSWRFRALDEVDGEPVCVESDIRIEVPE